LIFKENINSNYKTKDDGRYIDIPAFIL